MQEDHDGKRGLSLPNSDPKMISVSPIKCPIFRVKLIFLLGAQQLEHDEASFSFAYGTTTTAFFHPPFLRFFSFLLSPPGNKKEVLRRRRRRPREEEERGENSFTQVWSLYTNEFPDFLKKHVKSSGTEMRFSFYLNDSRKFNYIPL